MSAASPVADRFADPGDDGESTTARLYADRAFWGVLVTQFLGAFNDNLFKQLVLLVCLDYKLSGGPDRQGWALALFAVPFVFLSGTAGWLSDRWPKKPIVVGCKALEIVVMAAGAAAFFLGGDSIGLLVGLLLAVLALMSVQSALFGPAKYGILPELFRPSDLPRANGAVQMTTFLAIVFGMAAAGLLKDAFDPGAAAKAAGAAVGSLYKVSLVAVGVAVLGTLASLFIRRVPTAEPGLPFEPSALAIHSSLWPLFKHDRRVPWVLFVASLFWLAGGLIQPAINALGKVQLGLGDTKPSLMAACVGFGIAAGCVLAGRLSGSRVRFGLVRGGAFGVAGVCISVWAVGFTGLNADAAQWVLYPLMALLGVFAGLFALPLQIFLQDRPPKELKGRMIGAMNVCTWIGIVASAGLYEALKRVSDGPLDPPAAGAADPDAAYHWVFAAVAALLVPVGLLFRPADSELGTNDE